MTYNFSHEREKRVYVKSEKYFKLFSLSFSLFLSQKISVLFLYEWQNALRKHKRPSIYLAYIA